MAILKIKQPNGSWAIVGDTSETIKFTEQQLTEEQKEQARLNIGAAKEDIPIIKNDLNFTYDPETDTWDFDPTLTYIGEAQIQLDCGGYNHFASLSNWTLTGYGSVKAQKIWRIENIYSICLNVKQTILDNYNNIEHYRVYSYDATKNEADGSIVINANGWSKWFSNLEWPQGSTTAEKYWEINENIPFPLLGIDYGNSAGSGLQQPSLCAMDAADLVKYHAERYADGALVYYDKSQSLTEVQKTQARGNIGAASDSSLSNYVPYKAVIQNTNPFGGKQLYINSIDNAFAAIDKKFYVQITYHKRFDDNGVEYPHVKEGAAKTDADYWVDGPITSTSGFDKNNNDLFNGNYEGGIRIAANGYAKIHVRFSNEEGWTPSTGTAINSVYGSYPYGTFYISYYYRNHPDLNKRSQYRCYNNGATHGYGWKKQDFTIFNAASDGITNIIESCSDEGSNQRTCMEFLIFSDDTTKAGPVEIEWKMTRPSFASNTPLLTNYGSNRVYWPMYFRQKMQGENKIAITPEGTITATSYIQAPVFKGAMEGKLILGDKTYDGSSTITIPVNDFAEKAELDNYLLKTGGTIAGNLSITGDLTIQGNTYTQDNETLRIADNIIEINSNKADNTTVLSGIAINKNSTSTYGIMYDPTNDTVKFGEGVTNAGVFSFNEGEGAPLAIRDDSNNIDDGAIMIFDKSKNKLVNSGYTIDTFKQWIQQEITNQLNNIPQAEETEF